LQLNGDTENPKKNRITNTKNKFMIQWYKKVVLENYANFNGRARRSEYWYYVLTNILIQFSFLVLFFILFAMEKMEIGLLFYLLMVLYSLATMIPSLAVGVRRMHDVGKSGWYLLIPIYSLVLAITEGEDDVNQYGENPKKLMNSNK
jgi:uncharacterized membrane protein YhaH (DUF805 family)